MLTKQVQFKGRDDQGRIHCMPLLDHGLVKTASAERSQLHPQIQDFVRNVKPTKHGIFVLVNAMGAGEIWGSNVNGDFFPERELIHSPSGWEKFSPYEMREKGKKWPWGYPTFMGAHPYKHHQNKDSSRAFGRVELATWNPKMRRVELVVYLDRALCKRFDAYDIIERVEHGEFPDVSMGCKVPYDVCSICQHKSKTPKDYCDHARLMMNKILPDGRKVFVYNPKPRFFDISFVFIGADKTAKVMAKLASQGNRICMGEFCVVPRLSAEVGEMYSSDVPDDSSGAAVWEKRAEWAGSETPTENQTGDYASSNISALDSTSGETGSPKKWGKEFAARIQAVKEKLEPKIYPPAVLETNSTDDEQHLKVANDRIQSWLHIHHVPVAIEWPKGTTRKYYSKTEPGKVTYEQKMKAHYGYIPGTIDSDGEQLDAYVGPEPSSEFVYIIHQLKDDGSHDELKVMLGYADEERAKKSYLDHMPPKRLGRIEATTIEVFKRQHLKAAKKKRIEVDSQTVKTASGSCDCHGFGDDCGGSVEKVAAAVFPTVQKSASHRKLSEIIKSIPAGPFSKEDLPKLEKSERDIPNETLDRMGEMDLKHALSTPAMMGIVLKPREFQRVMLVHIREKPLADALDQEKKVFEPSSSVEEMPEISPDRVHHLLQELLVAMGIFRDRSAARTPLHHRMQRLQERRRDSREEQTPEKTAFVRGEEPLLRKLAAAYNGYRRNIIKKAAAIEQHLGSDPQLHSELFGQSMAQAFAGGIVKTSSTSVFGPDSLAYLTGAYHQDRELHVADRSVRASLAQMGALAEAMS